MSLQQQRVPHLKFDVADFPLNALTVAREGDDGGVIHRAKSPFLNGLANQGASARNDGLDETALRTTAVQLENLVGRRRQAAYPLQLDDGLDNADEDEPIVRL